MTRQQAGKRAGARKGPRAKRSAQPLVLLLTLGITAAVIAWGYLVWAAIDFGGEARDGEAAAWALMAVAAIGACACLFFGLMLVARLSRALGISQGPEPRRHGSHGAHGAVGRDEAPEAHDPISR